MLLATQVKTLVDDGDEHNMLNVPSVDSVGVSVLSGPSATTGPSQSAQHSESILKQANHGELDWSYTSRCARRWSPNSLLTHLYSHAFSVPPSDPQFWFHFVKISVSSQDGDDPEIISLPQAYRLPLLMVTKYLWETVHMALSAGREEWIAQTTNIFHISRLCENLFAGARVKIAKGGMEMGWRCLMFDRFLTRFYNNWVHNDPASNERFWQLHQAKEYDKDVLKHDWKGWSLTGLNGIRLTEQEVRWGLSANQFRKTLTLNQDSQTWTLEGKTLSFITSDEGPGWSSVSELTDVDLGEDDEEVKPSLYMLASTLSTTPKEPGAGSPAKRLRFSHRSSHLLPRKAPDQARLSTLRRSARTPSGLASSPSFTGPSATSFPEPGPSQGTSSSNIQTPIRPSSRGKQSSSGLVVLIKRRPQVPQTESLEQNSISSTHAERSNVPTVIDLTRLSPPPNVSRRASRPSSKKKESEAARRAKRRRIDSGKGKDPVQTSTHLAPRSLTNGLEPNGVPYSWDIQHAKSMHVDVSVQTIPTIAIAIEQGTQTVGCIDPMVIVERAVVIGDSTRTPTATIAAKSASDVAIQADLTRLRDDNSLKANQVGNEITEGCTAEMQENLSLVVDNLVSSRLVSLMRALKQSSEQPVPTSGSGTDSSSPTLCDVSGLPSTSKEASGMDRNMVNGLFDEVRLLREEAHAREQRTREEMQALRQLHNAEVDSLRRRLAYLESQSHEQPINGCDTRRATGEPSRAIQIHTNGGNSTSMHPRLGDRNYHFPDDDAPSSSFGVPSLKSPDPPVPGSLSNGNSFSGRLFSAKRSHNDMEEGSPLPSKTQRKSHIIRPSAIGQPPGSVFT